MQYRERYRYTDGTVVGDADGRALRGGPARGWRGPTVSTVFNSTVRLVGISYRAKKWICFKVGNYEKNSYGSRARLCSRALRRWLGAVASRHAMGGGDPMGYRIRRRYTQWHLSDLLSELDSYGKRSMAGLPGRGIGMNARLDCKMSHITFPDRVASRRASPALKRDASVARIMVIPHRVFTLQASARVTRHHAIPE